MSNATDRNGGSGLIAPAMVVAAMFFGQGTALAGEGIGGAEIVVNEVKGNLAPNRVVAILRGDEVYRDEGVQTGPDSSAKVVLRDNTVVTVGASSNVKLDRFVYAGEGQRGAIALNLVKGSLVFATGNAEKHSYLITTPTAALGVRGTIFRVEATASKTQVVLEEGAINVCMRSRVNRRCVDLDHPGQAATVTVAQVAVTASPASPAPHAPSSGAGAPAAAPAAPAPAAAPAAPAAAPAAPAAAPAAPAAAPAAPAAAPSHGAAAPSHGAAPSTGHSHGGGGSG